jgi:hypothetical protein
MVLDLLPGGLLVQKGLRDLAAGEMTDDALLVAIGAPRLRSLGIEVPASDVAEPEATLYRSLSTHDVDSAHSRYNALIRQLVSFERAFESGAR